MLARPCRPLAAAFSFCLLSTGSAHAQAEPTPDFVVTATRTPQAVSRAGSAITVITADEIAKESPKSIADVLRRSPGLSVTESGGPGSATTVRIRGAESRHTMVLIDGIRVNDPSQGSGEFDFASLVPTEIERIEVLRGPQSALYGSDAIGGVINIITRKGSGAPRVHASAEAGSYASKGVRAGISGANGSVNYAFGLSGYDTAGFSRYGYRIGRIERSRLTPLEADSTRRLGVTGRVGVVLSEGVELEAGGYASANDAQYDAFADDSPSLASQQLFEGYTRLSALTFGGILHNSLTLSATRTDRKYKEISAFCHFPKDTNWCRDNYFGDRLAAEYQGDLKLGRFGLLTLGGRIEDEGLRVTAQDVRPVLSPRIQTNDVSQTTRSLFAIHQISPIENLHLSFGGRIDDVEDSDTFATWRATAAYEFLESRTVLRGSAGTGAKAPTLFQLYDPVYGTAGLTSERSFGVDAGIDQRLFDDRLVLSATAFYNRFRDLIDFSFSPTDCPPANVSGCFLNITRARSAGIELSADLEIVPAWLRAKVAYTYTNAIDAITDERLARRPLNEARVGLVVTPVRGLSIEPTLILVGERYSSAGEGDRLAPYAILYIYADYRNNDRVSVFARGENLTNAHYQEVLDFGTAGRSIYGGLRATW
jgi:vitamin B12 transporter